VKLTFKSLVFFILFVLIIYKNIFFANALEESIKIPLDYHSDYGVYTSNIQANNHKGLIDVIIDTGSPILIILGDKKICPDCKPYITKKTIPKNTTYHSSNNESLLSTKLKVTFPNNIPIEFDSHVITDGSHNSNIMGISPVSKDWQKYYSLKNIFGKLKIPEKFSFLLCGTKNNALILGDFQSNNKRKKPITKIRTTKLYLNDYYTIKLSGIENHQNSPLIKYYPENYANVIIDSGTGGLIVVPDDDYHYIIEYIKRFYTKHNTTQRLSNDFWYDNYCIKNEQINNKKFPEINLTFPNFYNKNQNITISLKPKTYITSGGCNKGYKRLSFTHYENYKNKTKHKKLPNDTTTDVFILGTPIFEEYGITIDLENPAKVKFFNKDFYCK
tara:strand:+ start:10510 stop:11670 length:1161 start_codon:yes stop_codon:yes gene_type:complete